MINPWQILGVHRGSTPDEIKQAYRKAQRTAHPDVGGTAEQSAQVTEAYDLLTDRKRLTSYLSVALLHGQPCPTCKGKGYQSKQKGLTDRVVTGCGTCGGRGLVGAKI